MKQSRYCRIIICRHVVVVDNSTDAAAAANSSHNNNLTLTDDVYNHHIDFIPTSTLATGSDTWGSLNQRIFNDTVIEDSDSPLLTLLVQLHPLRHRFTAYRLRFGYGYATIIFPTWLRKQQHHQSQRDDEIVDALLDVNVSICPSNDQDVNNFNQSNTATTTTTTSTTPSYYEPHETILDSIGETNFSTTTNLELHYHWMPQSTIVSVPVIKERTIICYCNEDEYFPGCIDDDYELIDGTSASSDGGGVASGSDGGREYSLPTTIVNTLPLGARVGGGSNSGGVNASSSGGCVVASSGGGGDGGPRTTPIEQIVTTTAANTNTKAKPSEVAQPNSRHPPVQQPSSEGSRRSSRLSQDSASVVASPVRSIRDSARNPSQSTGKQTRESSCYNLDYHRKLQAMREKQAGEDRNASSGDGENDHEVRGEPTRATTEQTKIAGGDDAGADIMREEQKFLDDDDPRQGGIDRLKGNKNEDKVSDLTTTNTVASPSGKNARRKEKRKMLAMKDGTALASHSTTTVDDKKSRDSDKLKISPSPARATVAFDIESSPRSLKRSKVDDEDMQQNDAESRQKLTVERAKDVAKQASVAQLDDANQPNQGAISIDSEKAPLVERDPHRKKGYIIHASSENIARDLAMAVAEAQKDAFAVKKRVPCRGRGIPDHNPTTAYIIIPEGIKHGDKLLCSHPECRESKKFRYCKHCKAPVTDSSFRWKHRHGEESENKRDDADETRTGSDLKRGGDEVVGKGEKEQEIKVTKPRITKSTTSKDLPTDTAQAGRGPSAFTLYVEEVRPMFEKTHPNLTPAELKAKFREEFKNLDKVNLKRLQNEAKNSRLQSKIDIATIGKGANGA